MKRKPKPKPKKPSKPTKNPRLPLNLELGRQIEELAQGGAEAADIIASLQLRERMATEPETREWFERSFTKGQATLRIGIARKLTSDAMAGKVTALKEMAEAWLEKHMDEAPTLEFAGGYRDRLEAIIKKVKARRAS